MADAASPTAATNGSNRRIRVVLAAVLSVLALVGLVVGVRWLV